MNNKTNKNKIKIILNIIQLFIKKINKILLV